MAMLIFLLGVVCGASLVVGGLWVSVGVGDVHMERMRHES